MKKKTFLSARLSGMGQTSEEKPTGHECTLCIDYPQAGEKVQAGHYAIRISGCAAKCQVMIDDGEWQTCRSADGFCWYDWAPEAGRHKIAVRARAGNKWLKAQRTCDVK